MCLYILNISISGGRLRLNLSGPGACLVVFFFFFVFRCFRLLLPGAEEQKTQRLLCTTAVLRQEWKSRKWFYNHPESKHGL